MSMSRKDFVLIADVIRDLVETSYDHEPERLDTLIDVMVRMSNALRDEHASFDPERFRAYIVTGTVLDHSHTDVAPNAGSAS